MKPPANTPGLRTGARWVAALYVGIALWYGLHHQTSTARIWALLAGVWYGCALALHDDAK